jgi:hypothetical protein
MLKLQFKGNTNRSLWLVDEKLSLGSHADNDIMLDGLGIDAFHASLEIQPSEIKLVSAPGSCFVNDMPVDKEHVLVAGDELRIGQNRMLILTAQQADELRKAANAALAAGGVDTAVTAWSLQAQHSKLKDQPYPITEKSVLGRSKDCDLAVPYKLLSRHHVEFTVREGHLYLKDLGSSNGSFVNDKRVSEARLMPGDKISFAKLVFIVKGPGAENELNKTMIRPAVNFDEELKKSASAAAAQSIKQQQLATEQVEPETPQVNKSNKLLPVLCLGLIALFAGYWFLVR